MSGYNSVGMMNNGTIVVEVREDTPVKAIFDKENALQVGPLIIKKPIKNKEFHIKVVFKEGEEDIKQLKTNDEVNAIKNRLETIADALESGQWKKEDVIDELRQIANSSVK